MRKRGQEFGGPRRRGFDDDNFAFSPPARRSSPRSPDSFGGPGGGGPRFSSPAPANGPVVGATVKWFNGEKGFGFVSLADGSGDAFLHVSNLEAIGLKSVNPGATIQCRIGQGPKGPQVVGVVDVDESTAQPVSSSRPPRPPRDSWGAGGGGGGGGGGAPDMTDAIDITGVVKWFSPEKGFGFVVADDGGRDVFVHTSIVRRAGFESLNPDQPVSMKVVTGQKGREAVSITLNDR